MRYDELIRTKKIKKEACKEACRSTFQSAFQFLSIKYKWAPRVSR